MKGFWKRIFGWWEVGWKQMGDFAEFFYQCNEVGFYGVLKCLWLIAIATAVWSLWIARN